MHGCDKPVRARRTGKKPDHVRVYEELQALGRQSADQLEDAEKKQNKLDAYHAKTLGEMVTTISAFCNLDLQWHQRRWDVYEKMIREAVEFPYPLYRPVMRSHLVAIVISAT